LIKPNSASIVWDNFEENALKTGGGVKIIFEEEQQWKS